jgi:hypothetical protein
MQSQPPDFPTQPAITPPQYPPAWQSPPPAFTPPVPPPNWQLPPPPQPPQPPQGRQTFWQSINGWSIPTKIVAGVGAGCSALIIACIACSALSLALGGSSPLTTQGNGVTATATTDVTATTEPTATTEATAAATTEATATATTHAQPTNTPRSHPTNTPCASPCNPWGYNFNPTGGTKITSPPSAFCSYFACIGSPPSYTSFWNGRGYVVECQDTKFSKSGGISGSCSQHGGDLRTLYAH